MWVGFVLDISEYGLILENKQSEWWLLVRTQLVGTGSALSLKLLH